MKASWFRTSGRYAVHRWLHALKQYRFASIHCTWARSGETEFCNLTLSCRLRSSSERRIETKFSLQLETLDVCITIFLYSTCKRQARRKPSTPAIRCWRPSSSWVDFETRSLLLFVANPRGLKLNCTHWHWASKWTWAWGWLHLFPKPHALSPIPANRARSLSADQAQIAIDDMATGRPRA